MKIKKRRVKKNKNLMKKPENKKKMMIRIVLNQIAQGQALEPVQRLPQKLHQRHHPKLHREHLLKLHLKHHLKLHQKLPQKHLQKHHLRLHHRLPLLVKVKQKLNKIKEMKRKFLEVIVIKYVHSFIHVINIFHVLLLQF